MIHTHHVTDMETSSYPHTMSQTHLAGGGGHRVDGFEGGVNQDDGPLHIPAT